MRIVNLRRLYSAFNRRWFRSRLPRRVDVQWAKRLNGGCLGLITESAGLPPIIEISVRLMAWPNAAKFTLLHEMCHLWVSTCKRRLSGERAHGNRWQGQMLHLAKAGAFRSLW